ncbi:hypothetical protein GCM10020000_32310 [Streptomyces olivoverticillatus]
MVAGAEQVAPGVEEAVGVVHDDEHHRYRRDLREQQHEEPHHVPYELGAPDSAPQRQRQGEGHHDQDDGGQEEGRSRQTHARLEGWRAAGFHGYTV